MAHTSNCELATNPPNRTRRTQQSGLPTSAHHQPPPTTNKPAGLDGVGSQPARSTNHQNGTADEREQPQPRRLF